MAYNSFRTGLSLRIATLFLTVLLAAWMIDHTQWYAVIAVCVIAIISQAALFIRFANRSDHDMARFLEAISYDDLSQSFSGEGAHGELATAMTQVFSRLRAGRTEREAQTHYLQTLINHVPVALISIEESGKAQLLNMAAKRLFESPLTDITQFSRHGTAFAVGMESLRAGETAILRMERVAGSLQLKAAVTHFSSDGKGRRLVSLQNIETEMSAQEMAAWQTVIRVMSHEVMNSLTPISSLAATAHHLVGEALNQLPADSPSMATLKDAHEALETVARRSEGLLHFVQSHRRLTKRLTTQIEVTPVQRIFARLQRLLASDLAARDIQMTTTVEPEALEIAADADLLDQALINLVRNAIEALRDTPAGRIALVARRDSDGHIAISVADNGSGISADLREKVFVPFFTTKRQGSGIGLTLVRQIATAHGATVDITQTPGGGATFSMRF